MNGAISIFDPSRPAARAPSSMSARAVLQVLVRPERRHPAVGGAAHDLADRLVLQRGDVDRDVRPARRHLELEVAGVEQRRHLGLEAPPRQERADDVDRVLEPRERLLVRHAVEVLDDELAARAEAQNGAALADLVERRDAHREEPRRPAEDVRDAGGELQPLRPRRDLGQELELLVRPCLGHPDRVVAEVVGQLGDPEDRRAVVALPERDDADAVRHRRSIGGPPVEIKVRLTRFRSPRLTR
jgi:hypothetical protein